MGAETPLGMISRTTRETLAGTKEILQELMMRVTSSSSATTLWEAISKLRGWTEESETNFLSNYPQLLPWKAVLQAKVR